MNDGWNKQIWLVIDAIKTMFTKDLIYGIQNPKSDIEKKGKSDLTQRPWPHNIKPIMLNPLCYNLLCYQQLSLDSLLSIICLNTAIVHFQVISYVLLFISSIYFKLVHHQLIQVLLVTNGNHNIRTSINTIRRYMIIGFNIIGLMLCCQGLNTPATIWKSIKGSTINSSQEETHTIHPINCHPINSWYHNSISLESLYSSTKVITNRLSDLLLGMYTIDQSKLICLILYVIYRLDIVIVDYLLAILYIVRVEW